jgi:hypothetical protein
MQNELAAPFVMTEELRAVIVQADNERLAQAFRLAIWELTPDMPKFVTTDPKSFKRWVKAVDDKTEEIFSRLN